jgi:hypothetical protein
MSQPHLPAFSFCTAERRLWSASTCTYMTQEASRWHDGNVHLHALHTRIGYQLQQMAPWQPGGAQEAVTPLHRRMPSVSRSPAACGKGVQVVESSQVQAATAHTVMSPGKQHRHQPPAPSHPHQPPTVLSAGLCTAGCIDQWSAAFNHCPTMLSMRTPQPRACLRDCLTWC